MNIATRTAGNVTVLDVSGEVDLYHSPALLGKLTELIKQQHKHIVLNFQNVSYIDSSGLATLIGAYQQLRPQGGQLRLSNVSRNVQNVFAVARLDKVFTIHPTENEAVQALSAG